MISIDTLRADHLGCYGYDRSTSPNMDELARKGLLFKHVIAQSSWTLPSHMSMLTGLYASTHTVETDGKRLPDNIPTLASVLNEAGYRTEGVVSSPYVGKGYGFGRGFDDFMMLPRPIPENSKRINEVSKERLENLSQLSEPFFLFIHYLGPHTPYDPPPPYDTMFDPDYTGTIDGKGGTIARFFNPKSQINEKDLAHIVALYDGEIAHMDQYIGELYQAIEEMGLSKDTVFIVTSDHGEEFKEHGSMDHGRSLYDEVIEVPWIMVCPGFIPENTVVDLQVQLIDIVPTVCSMLGIEIPQTVQGVSMDALIRGGFLAKRGHDHPDTAFSEMKMQGARPATMKAVRSLDGLKLIVTEEPGKQVELYQVREDPKEIENLSAKQGSLVDRLTGKLLDLQSKMKGAQEGSEQVVWSKDERQTLHELGYLGRGAQQQEEPKTGSEKAGPLGRFKQPRGIEVSEDGEIFVADFRNFRIQRLDDSLHPLGAVGKDGRGKNPGQLNDPCDVAVAKDGALYVADTMNGRIQMFNSDGSVGGAWGQLFAPRGIALSRDGSKIYVSETGNSCVVVYSLDGQKLATWGGKGDGIGKLDRPIGIEVDDQGNIWVAERGNARLQVFDENGQSQRTLKIAPWENDCRISEPYFDFTPTGEIVLSAPSQNEILKYSRDGKLLARAKSANGVQFQHPAGVACLSDGRVIVSDTWNHRVALLDPEDFVSG